MADRALCVSPIVKHSDRNLVQGCGEFKVDEENLSLEFAVHSATPYIYIYIYMNLTRPKSSLSLNLLLILTREARSREARVVMGRRKEGRLLSFLFLLPVTPRSPLGHASCFASRDSIETTGDQSVCEPCAGHLQKRHGLFNNLRKIEEEFFDEYSSKAFKA